MVPCLVGPLCFFSSLLDQSLVLKRKNLFFHLPAVQLAGNCWAPKHTSPQFFSHTCVKVAVLLPTLLCWHWGQGSRGVGNTAEVPDLPQFRKHLHIRCNLGSFFNVVSKPLFSTTLVKAVVQQTEAVLPTYLMPTYWVNLLFGLAALNSKIQAPGRWPSLSGRFHLMCVKLWRPI